MTENNKVIYDGQTLIDLTQDDVTASDVRSGVYFHSADGVRGQGTLTSTSIPTADTIAEWDSDVHMNSEDMTSQEVEDFVDDLNVTGITAVDYIVEQGTDSNGWYYRKWHSGYMEASINVSSPTLGTASTVNGVILQVMTMPTPPTMVTKYDINASGTNSGCWVAYGFDSLNNPTVSVHRISGSVIPNHISISIKGTWK